MNIILLGAQGSGKGAVSEYLVEKYGFKHISTGDLFRNEIAKKTKLGKTLASYMNKGNLVPNEIVMETLKGVLQSANNTILDGFPRTMEQAKLLSTITKVDLVIYVDVPKQILMQRLTSRRHCADCKQNYSMLTYSKDVCEKCGGKLVRRDDDFEDAINKRLSIFYSNIEQILEYYKSKNVLTSIDNSGSYAQTHNQIDKIMHQNERV
ncbi:MAG: nucleoside monophosphate kinase [Clostridia bacterium]|nr:nucleoside monophosphate kinase [Clostridia bacterium]